MQTRGADMETLLVLAQTADFVACLVCGSSDLHDATASKLRRLLVGERSEIPGHRKQAIFPMPAGASYLEALREHDAKCGVDANAFDPHGARHAALIAGKRDSSIFSAERASNPLLIGWWQRAGAMSLLAEACGERPHALDLVAGRIVAHPFAIYWWYAARDAHDEFAARFPGCAAAVAPLRSALAGATHASDSLPKATYDERLCARCVAQFLKRDDGNVVVIIERAVRDVLSEGVNAFAELTYAFLALLRRNDLVKYAALWRTCLKDSDAHFGAGDGRYVLAKRGRTVPIAHAALAEKLGRGTGAAALG